MAHRIAWGVVVLATAAGCSASAGEPSSTGAEGALSEAEAEADGSITFTLDEDANVTVEAHSASRETGRQFNVVVRRGRASHGYSCVLSRDDNATGTELLTCGPLTLSRDPGDRYALSVSRAYETAAGAGPWDPNDPVIVLEQGDHKRLNVTRAGETHPFALADRIRRALERLVGAAYEGAPIRRVAGFREQGLRLQPRFEYGVAQPYAITKDCTSERRPSLLADPEKPEAGFVSETELAERYRKFLEAPADSSARCK